MYYIFGTRTSKYLLEEMQSSHSVSYKSHHYWYKFYSFYSTGKNQGSIKLTKSVTVPPFQTIHVSRITGVKCPNKIKNAIMVSSNSRSLGEVTAFPTYTKIKSHTCKEEVCLRNLSARSTTLKVRNVIAKLTVANCCIKWALEANCKCARMLKEKRKIIP